MTELEQLRAELAEARAESYAHGERAAEAVALAYGKQCDAEAKAERAREDAEQHKRVRDIAEAETWSLALQRDAIGLAVALATRERDDARADLEEERRRVWQMVMYASGLDAGHDEDVHVGLLDVIKQAELATNAFPKCQLHGCHGRIYDERWGFCHAHLSPPATESSGALAVVALAGSLQAVADLLEAKAQKHWLDDRARLDAPKAAT